MRPRLRCENGKPGQARYPMLDAGYQTKDPKRFALSRFESRVEYPESSIVTSVTKNRLSIYSFIGKVRDVWLVR
jgi:hypothetical protein